MNIKRAKEEIKDTVEAYLLKDEFGEYVIPTVHQRPILLIGPPGIGKTQIMEQVAEECNIGLVAYTITHHTRQSAIGLPFISHKTYQGKEYAMTEYTMSEIIASIYEKMNETGWTQGILFIDEINCVSETLAPAMLQFLQCKTFGTHKIPEGWIIAAAGNPPEYNKSVREFDIVTMDRVKKILVEADYTAWKEYAYKAGVHPAVLGYLNARQKNFYIMENTVDGRLFATPRGWEDVSRMLEVYDKLGKTMDHEVVEQYIQHPRTAKDFANYLELYKKYQVDYQIDAVLEGRIDPILLKKSAHASLDEKLSVVSLLLAGLNNQFREVIRQENFMEALVKALKEYQVGMTDSAQRKLAAKEYQDSMTDGVQRKLAAKESMIRENRDGNSTAGAQNGRNFNPEAKTSEGYDENPDFEGYMILKYLLAEKQHSHDIRRENGLMNREEEFISRRLLATLSQFMKMAEQAKDPTSDGVLTLLRDAFAKESEALEEMQDRAGEMLEHAFDFLEAAYGGGQETAIFMTELNSGYYALKFLEEYECERYDQYNQSFLFDEKRAGLLQRMDELEHWG